jgi:enoyl-CoA hydratase/carnithine racemase
VVKRVNAEPGGEIRLNLASIESEILFERRGAAGLVTLNRPHALNAVTHAMVRGLAAKLDEWAHDRAVTRVVVRGAGERAFSAGGDIRALYELGRAGRHNEALRFWWDEYRLNFRIHRYPKPYIALIDGIVMGGGAGISVHGSHRIAGDGFLFAMPEVGIGFFPDVGATWVLPRMPGETGCYCALTGDRLKTADGLGIGIATHHVPSRRLPELLDALCGTQSVDAILPAFAAVPNAPAYPRRAIDRLFAGERVETILDRLDQVREDAGWAAQAAEKIRTKSPTSLKIALAQVRRGKHWSFAQCMRAEFRIVSRIVYGHDFYEGTRALIIDKDNAPRWQPCDLAAVTDAEVERHFAPLAVELEL